MLFALFTEEETKIPALRSRVTRCQAKMTRGPPQYVIPAALQPVSGITTLTSAKNNNGTVSGSNNIAVTASVAQTELKPRKTSHQVHAITVNNHMKTQLKKRANNDAYTTAIKKIRYEREHLLSKDRATLFRS